ncbi:RimJ/RimL family protein N-acetyltransferase [Bacillus pakistanensis]|uniref:RimJ/RimL family protein N-acetyltransferase n=1 Tax=Rossellomorea pakistanensis TaxID=992288 RepID=A0ABS2NF57_9BACI|nr:GNAT family protein [Bacillus pakistanensis]MBM7586467.1 RimJ/RimL family protein N-acetyltransferase [Bacillus pakistanensis]
MDYSILKGKRIELSGFLEEDLPIISSWSKNEHLQRNLDALPFKPKTNDEIQKWMNHSSEKDFRFAIRLMDTNELIGYVEVDGILWTHRTGWVTIAIGDGRYWGDGYGKEALTCLISYAFQELNLFRLQLTVFSYNERAIKLYKSLGFEEEGRFRKFLQRDGDRYDMILFGLLKDEWKKNNES